MPTIPANEAVGRLIREVEENLPADELLEIRNELIPGQPRLPEEAVQDKKALMDHIVAYLNSGLPMEEVAEMWNLIFTRHRNVWYNEMEDQIHYNEEREPSYLE